MIDLAQRVDTTNVRQVVLGPRKYADVPPPSETNGIYELRLKMDVLAALSDRALRPVEPLRRDGLTSGSSAALQHRRDRLGDDLEIEPDRPAVDVGEVERDPAVEVVVSPRRDLPQTR